MGRRGGSSKGVWGRMGGASDPVPPVQGLQKEVMYKARPDVCAASEKQGRGEQRCPSRESVDVNTQRPRESFVLLRK